MRPADNDDAKRPRPQRPGPTDDARRQPHLSLRLLRAIRPTAGRHYTRIGELIENLGEGSFGWCLLAFALINLMPMPVGANVLTAIPLLLLTAQMALGWHHVHVPAAVARRRVDATRLRRAVHAARPLTVRLQRFLRPRLEGVFSAAYYRFTGVLLLAVSTALFLPIPFSGWISAGALFVYAAGLIAGDGLIALIGLILGVCALAVTATMGSLLLLGLNQVF